MKSEQTSFSKICISAVIKCSAFFGLMLLPSLLFAQDRGKVEVVKNPKVDSLIGNYLVAKKGNMPEQASADGYRVQIFSGSNRKEAYKAQATFQDKYPDVRTYLSYHEPNFKVHVGDFRSRLEAEKLMEELRPWFTGLFIITETINLPKLDTE